jgi:integrase
VELRDPTIALGNSEYCPVTHGIVRKFEQSCSPLRKSRRTFVGGALGQRQITRLFAHYCEVASRARIARGEAPIANSVRHVHCLKHSRGTSLAERGVNPYRIKLILGHKSMASTERYLHAARNRRGLRRTASSMEVF